MASTVGWGTHVTTPYFGAIFHFTHIDNLPAILDREAVLADNVVVAEGLLSIEAGHQGIKERRRSVVVPCGAGGVVADYVPFYFAARSPMMLPIASGRVPTFNGDHRDLVYFVSDVATVADEELPFVFTDRNAAKAVADFSDDLADLGDLSSPQPSCDFVDWSIMNNAQWNDVPGYPDRQERRMAEFLVHERFPLEAVLRIGVHRDAVRTTVEQMFASHGWGTPVDVEPDWYYA